MIDMVTDLPCDFTERVVLLNLQINLFPHNQFRHILCDWAADIVFHVNPLSTLIATPSPEGSTFRPPTVGVVNVTGRA